MELDQKLTRYFKGLGCFRKAALNEEKKICLSSCLSLSSTISLVFTELSARMSGELSSSQLKIVFFTIQVEQFKSVHYYLFNQLIILRFIVPGPCLGPCPGPWR